jgi:hypothetical protein
MEPTLCEMPPVSAATVRPALRATPAAPPASDASGMDMRETSRPAARSARGRDDQETSIPAIRHVGRTLESDPAFTEDDREGEELTPEAQVAYVGAPADTTMGRGATDLSADVSSTDDALRASLRNAAPEPLKTRLPGDTSSDPHTDLGPDNATTTRD